MSGEAQTLFPAGAPEQGDGFDQIMAAQNFSSEFVDGTSERDLEPFGTHLGVEAVKNMAGTGGPTADKGGGNYDDWATSDE